MTEQMRAWRAGENAGSVEETVSPIPELAADEVLVKVQASGLCRTDLHVIDHDLPVHLPGVIPGHQVVGTVVGRGSGVRSFAEGATVGVAWLRRTCGVCEWCRSGAENLCPRSEYTGWDADGGFAEYVAVPEGYAYPLPDGTDPVETAPLLCAGIIGFRALMRANLPPGGRLGIYGFGSSAHITAQLAMGSGARVYAMTRGDRNRQLARQLNVEFVGGEVDEPPVPLDAAIVFAPAGSLVPVALRATRAGGTVVLAGIHMSDIPELVYESSLFHERDLRTVTANTRNDGSQFLRVAATLGITPTVTRLSFDEVGRGLDDLRQGRVSGSLVMVPGW